MTKSAADLTKSAPDGYKFCSGPDCSKLLSLDEERANKAYCSTTCGNRAANARKRRAPDYPERSRARWQAEKARLASVKAGNADKEAGVTHE